MFKAGDKIKYIESPPLRGYNLETGKIYQVDEFIRNGRKILVLRDNNNVVLSELIDNKYELTGWVKFFEICSKIKLKRKGYYAISK